MTRTGFRIVVRAALVAAFAFTAACGSTAATDAGSGGGTGGHAGGGAGGGATGGGSGTGGSATGGGTGGSGGTGGGATGGGGGTCTPQVVVMTMDAGCGSALPAPGACGGNPTGTWCVTDYCVDPSPLLGSLSTLCSSASFKSFQGTVQGTASFVGTATDGTYLRDSQLSIDAVIDIPAACLFGGFITCDAMATVIKNRGYDAGCDVIDGGGCLCNAGQSVNDTSNGTYSAQGGLLDAGNGRYQYCVDGSTLRYHKVQPANSEPGVATMSK